MDAITAKLKPLRPTLRERKRYVAFEVISKKPVQRYDTAYKAIEKAIDRFSGNQGLSEAGMLPLQKNWNQSNQRGLLRVSHKKVDKLRAAMTFITQIDDSDALIHSVGVSGILKKAQEQYIAS